MIPGGPDEAGNTGDSARDHVVTAYFQPRRGSSIVFALADSEIGFFCDRGYRMMRHSAVSRGTDGYTILERAEGRIKM